MLGELDVQGASLLSEHLRSGHLCRAGPRGATARSEVAGATPPGATLARPAPFEAAGDSGGDELVKERLEGPALVDGQAAGCAGDERAARRSRLARAPLPLRGEPHLDPAPVRALMALGQPIAFELGHEPYRPRVSQP